MLARARARDDAAEARRTAARNTAQIATAVSLAIEHQEDLAVGAGGFWADNPGATTAELDDWARSGHLLHRFPGVQQVGFVALVPASELTAFRARIAGRPTTTPPSGAPTSTSTAGTAAQEPAGSSAPPATSATKPGATVASTTDPATTTTTAQGSTTAPAGALSGLRITPSSAHRYYCLTVAQLARRSTFSASTGHDYCARGAALLLARDSGATSYALVSVAHKPALVARVPLYRGNATPHGTAQRRAAFLGWLHEQLVPGAVLRQALHGVSGDAVQLRYHHGASNVLIGGGTPQPGAARETVAVHGGWTMTSSHAPIHASLLGDGDARTVLIAGVLLSLMAAALVFLAIRRPTRRRIGRRRAPATVHGAADESLYDELTGLPNPALAHDRAEWLIARSGRQPGLLVGALVIDLDWFTEVNEKLGRAAGDQLLSIVAERLEGVVRAGDTVARLKDDEFLVLVEAVARGARLDFLAGRVIEALRKPFELDDFGPSFFLTASIGVAFGRYDGAEDLMRDAQLALDAAKAAGKDRYTLFNANMRAVIEGGGALEAELNKALQHEQLFLEYQPVFDLRSGKVTAMEALLRWQHPARGVVPAREFITAAEEMGLSVPIGRWMLNEACGQAAAWNVAGHDAGVSVSVSARQLNRDGFTVDVRRALQQSGVQAELLTLQIAEATVIRDLPAAAQRLEEVRQLGVRVAIDDFGASGYAYHRDLQRLPLDFLRVDRSSLAVSDDEEYRSWLLEAILLLGREYDLTVIAKEVETYQQMTTLKAMGCPMVQGFFMGKPTPAEDVEGLFATELPVASSAGEGHLENGSPTGWVHAQRASQQWSGSSWGDGPADSNRSQR